MQSRYTQLVQSATFRAVLLLRRPRTATAKATGAPVGSKPGDERPAPAVPRGQAAPISQTEHLVAERKPGPGVDLGVIASRTPLRRRENSRFSLH